ncbi:MAG: nicotinamide riboside transporter PnuC, partial [Pseudomonadota bacterium]|nr:nicotinamide riboside transporter PnuC [Pseudomonadota bacterium]
MLFLIENWFEILGVASGLLCVLLLIRENVLNFPIGLIYALITTVVVTRANLYADALLNVYYVLMNAYGWYYWRRGGAERRRSDRLMVARVSTELFWRLGWITLVGSLLLGWGFDRFTDADLSYADSFTTVASFVAMWMTAKKYLEC